ncbi:unnamed protein product [Linum tenue]|uniref:Sulfotransferase n=1 Tax=Linum tenue TaxID=586396 RepID=A0AAV0NP01_9ROSI|nr:unnamed protein product [Linum tenue]
MKTGTTWLKALCYNILDEQEDDILASKNPHDAVPTLEIAFFQDQVQQLLLNPPPPAGRSRLLHTHFPYGYLPEKVRSSGCKLVYVSRNPKDTLEDLCRNPEEQVRKLASFLGRKTSVDVEKVLWRSNLNRLKELEIPNTIFFRTGTVGDWKNYLTSDIAQRLDDLTRDKLQGTALSFDDE